MAGNTNYVLSVINTLLDNIFFKKFNYRKLYTNATNPELMDVSKGSIIKVNDNETLGVGLLGIDHETTIILGYGSKIELTGIQTKNYPFRDIQNNTVTPLVLTVIESVYLYFSNFKLPRLTWPKPHTHSSYHMDGTTKVILGDPSIINKELNGYGVIKLDPLGETIMELNSSYDAGKRGSYHITGCILVNPTTSGSSAEVVELEYHDGTNYITISHRIYASVGYESMIPIDIVMVTGYDPASLLVIRLTSASGVIATADLKTILDVEFMGQVNV